MAIPVILKGETAKPIQLALADGYEYAGCSLHVNFCGLRDTFIDLVAGGSLELRYTAEQTAGLPLGTSKVMLSIENARGELRFMPWAKIKVTDSPADLYDAAITIDPATLNVDDLTSKDTLGTVKSRLNAVMAFLRALKVLALAALPLGVYADVAPLYTTPNEMPGDAPLMTNTEAYVEAKVAEAGKVQSVNGKTGTVTLSAGDVGALSATGTALRASSVGSAERWTDATGCVWQATFDVGRDWWTIEPAESARGMSVFWDGDSWVLRYEGFDNDTGYGSETYSFGFRLGIQYAAKRHPGGAAVLVDRVALRSQILTPDFTTNNVELMNTIAVVSPKTDISGKQDILPYPTNAIPIDAIDYWIEQKRDRGDVTADGWLLIGPDGKHELLWYFTGNEQVSAWYSSDISKYITRATIDSDVFWSLSVDTHQTTAFYPADATELTFTYDSANTYKAIRIYSRFAFMSDVAAATNALAAKIVAPDVIATNLVKTVISNSLYNLTYDQTLGVTWRKTAEGGAFYERCYTNINLIGVQP